MAIFHMNFIFKSFSIALRKKARSAFMPTAEIKQTIERSPEIFIHRGGNQKPENSLEAIRETADLGYKAVEIDVTFSKDLIPFVYHGWTYHGIQTVSDINKLTAFEIAQRKPNLPTLKEALGELKRLDLKAEIHLFHGDIFRHRSIAKTLGSLIEKSGVSEQVFVSSFHPNVLKLIKSFNKRIQTCLLIRRSVGLKPLDRILRSQSLVTGCSIDEISVESGLEETEWFKKTFKR